MPRSATWLTAAKRVGLPCLALAAFSIWMRAGFPVYAIHAIFDDALFVHLARRLVDGEWLGRFDNETLVKGAFYPFFIDVAYLLRIPLKIAEQIAYIPAAFLVSSLLMRKHAGFRQTPILGVVMFAALCLNPVVWTAELARVIREGIYLSLSLGVIGLTATVSFPTRPGSSTLLAAGKGLCLGVALGAFWITREEGPWLVPAIGTIAVIGAVVQASRPPHLIDAGQPSPDAALFRIPWPLLTSSLAAAAAFCMVIWFVSAENERHYGMFETNEVKSPAFEQAYGALARIKPDHWQRYIVFPKDARDRAYAVSPLAKELEKTFDGPFGQSWAQVHCKEYAILPCSGVHAGWFQWVLRQAAAQAGHYTSARDAAEYYAHLALEINAACADGRLECLPPRATLMPPFRPEYIGDTLRETRVVFKTLLHMHEPGAADYASEGSPEDLAMMAAMVGRIAPPVVNRFVVRGWLTFPSLDPAPTLDVRSTNLSLVNSSVRASRTPSSATDKAIVQFALTTDCSPEHCDLVLSTAKNPATEIPMARLVHGSIDAGSVELSIASADPELVAPMTLSPPLPQYKLARVIARCYQIALRTLWPFACVGLLCAIAFRRHVGAPALLYALALGSAVAVVCRVLLLSYLEVTSIPSNNILYLSPAMPFLIIFVVLGPYLGSRAASGLLFSSGLIGRNADVKRG